MMFGGETDQPSQAISASVLASTTLQGVATSGDTSANGAGDPANDLGRAMRDTARRIKAGIGVRVVAIDYGAFDHHVDVGAMNGSPASQLQELARGVAAFFTDLGAAGRPGHA